MAYYAVDVKRSFLVIVKADSEQVAEKAADNTIYLDGDSEGAEVLGSYDTLEMAREVCAYDGVECELNENGEILD